ncbi:Hypothetical protein NGAL_HAMBI1145_49280 [Neorhizobium galegae bv. officinalis]|uniref:Peptidase M41 domain-containing protein n=1 Tax=Neorhizobium galegae bv. officinalis TaxID=323656 RepID=A0A0T7FWZ0_NEOGA|nr:hypothetical protein [Neorhizobium galegae]CDZ39531.1 Hypothetical protein NGAL_HAMBI1145_49280 [Neorhizobium galegae bv. officinalis]
MMEITWAFGETMTSEVYEKSEDLAKLRIRREGLSLVVESTLRTQLERAESILASHREALDMLTERLRAEKSLTALDVAAAVGKQEYLLRAKAR